MRNRTQDEVDADISAAEAMQIEADFFAGHPELSTMPQEVLGKPALVNKLVEIQADVICRNLPGLLQKVRARGRQHAGCSVQYFAAIAAMSPFLINSACYTGIDRMLTSSSSTKTNTLEIVRTLSSILLEPHLGC